MIRLNKYISNSGLCTRRDADAYIVDGRVKVDKKIVKTLNKMQLINVKTTFELFSYIVISLLVCYGTLKHIFFLFFEEGEEKRCVPCA